MLVSHQKKFIYTKTAKTAGTSVESYFEKYCMPEGEWEEAHSRDMHISNDGIIGFRGKNRPLGTKWYNHMSAEKMKRILGDDIWNSYLKFCIVRDPFDKAVSAFFHFEVYRHRKKLHKPTLKQRLRRGLRPRPKFKTTSAEFEYWLAKNFKNKDRDKYLIDGELCVDEIIRFEALHEGLEMVCDKIGAEFVPSRLPQFKKGLRDDQISLAEIYTPKSIEIVSSLYTYEIGRFGYSAPNLK